MPEAVTEHGIGPLVLERGLEDSWDDLVLVRALDAELDRERPVERVGRTYVERLQRERAVVEVAVDGGSNA